ncbi:kinase, putative [Ricinus communis]|uniref:Kinase, putative n=1 Tax=Ricinus communis TaxID=3988 RepID=B9RQ91_RICCO|nr:kinase, putative [Ricinus communis]
MVVFCRFLFKFLCVLAHTVLVHGQNQSGISVSLSLCLSGFISLDCGLAVNSSYTAETGISKSISSEFNLINQQIQNVRAFPEGVRNCYNVELVKDTKYLIRVIFLYGNYDGLNKIPAFDLHLGLINGILCKSPIQPLVT